MMMKLPNTRVLVLCGFMVANPGFRRSEITPRSGRPSVSPPLLANLRGLHSESCHWLPMLIPEFNLPLSSFASPLQQGDLEKSRLELIIHKHDWQTIEEPYRSVISLRFLVET